MRAAVHSGGSEVSRSPDGGCPAPPDVESLHDRDLTELPRTRHLAESNEPVLAPAFAQQPRLREVHDHRLIGVAIVHVELLARPLLPALELHAGRVRIDLPPARDLG